MICLYQGSGRLKKHTDDDQEITEVHREVLERQEMTSDHTCKLRKAGQCYLRLQTDNERKPNYYCMGEII